MIWFGAILRDLLRGATASAVEIEKSSGSIWLQRGASGPGSAAACLLRYVNPMHEAEPQKIASSDQEGFPNVSNEFDVIRTRVILSL